MGHGLWYFTGENSSGTKQMIWREHANDNSNNRTGVVHNPNNGDDSRLPANHTTNLIIMEFAA